MPGEQFRPLGSKLAPARKAPRNINSKVPACLVPGYPVRGCGATIKQMMTLGNGYLGSRIDEERSEMRYLV